MTNERTTGMIPGDRGKAGGSWCRHPLDAVEAARRHISPVPLAGVVSGQFTHESGTVPRGVIRNRAERSQVHGEFRPGRRRSYPRGYGCYCADQNASGRPGGTTPPEGPTHQTGRGAQGTDEGAERTDLAKSVNLLDRAVLKTGSPYCQAKRSLRDKEVRPVTRGQRPAKSRRRPRGKGADAKSLWQACQHHVRRNVPGRERPNRA
jgi:hypothetical protein